MTFRNLSELALGAITKTLGEPVTYTPTAGSAASIKGVFNEKYEQVDPDTRATISTDQPNLLIRLSDLAAAPAEGDQVVIRTKTYKVFDWKPDGEGGSLLLLHEAA